MISMSLDLGQISKDLTLGFYKLVFGLDQQTIVRLERYCTAFGVAPQTAISHIISDYLSQPSKLKKSSVAGRLTEHRKLSLGLHRKVQKPKCGSSNPPFNKGESWKKGYFVLNSNLTKA